MLATPLSIFQRRDLLLQLVIMEVRTSTAGRMLGWLWWLLDPLLMMLIYWFVVQALLGRGMSPGYNPYWLFVFFGLITWKHAGGTITQAANSLVAGRALIRAVPFPTAILPLSRSGAGFFFFLAGMGVAMIMRLSVDWPAEPGYWLVLLQLVPLMVLQLAIVSALALPAAVLGAMIRDLSNLSRHALRIGFYLSPGLYSAETMRASMVSRLGESTGQLVFDVYMLNPFAIMMEGYRTIVLEGRFIAASDWTVLLIEAAVFALAGVWIYNRYDRRIVKYI